MLCESKFHNAGRIKALYLLFFILFLTAEMHPQWVQTNGPYGGYIRTLTFCGTDLFATTDQSIFLSIDNGNSWSQVSSEFPAYGVKILASIKDNMGIVNLFVSSFEGLFRSTDNGKSWIKIYSDFPPVKTVAMNGANLFAGTYFFGKGSLLRSTDNGTSWTKINPCLTDTMGGVNAITFIPNDIGDDNTLLVSTIAGLFSSTNNGTDWNLVASNFRCGEFTICPNEAVGNNIFTLLNGGVYLSTDNGMSWTGKNSGLPTNDYVTCLAGSIDGKHVFAGTENNGIFCSTNNGTSWIDANSGLPKVYINDITLSPDGLNIFAGVAWRGVFRSTDNGLNWTETNTGIIEAIVESFAVKGNNLFVGTTNGVFLYNSNGTTWSSLNSGFPSYRIISSLCFDGQNLLAGLSGDIYFSSNSGTSWAKSNINIGPGSYVISFVINGTTLFAGTQYEGIFRSTDGGINWEKIFTNTQVAGLITIGTNVFASTGSGVFLSTDNGESWVAKNNGLTKYEDGNYYLRDFAVNRENLFVGSEKGVFRSTDNGGSWAAVNTGLPLNTDVYAFAVNGENIFIGTGRYTDTNVIAGVFLSTNNGTSWNDISSGLPQIGSISALAISGNNLFAGTDGLGVWYRPLSEITDVENTSQFSKEFALYQNYPNPFNPSTKIQYAVSSRQLVTLKIYDLLGRELATLVNEEKSAGSYEVSWNAANLPSGVYFYQLKAGNYSATKKLLLLK